MRGIEALSDVPTIVPIVLSLVLFFSSVVWAINRVNSIDDDIQLSLDAVRVAETFTQTAYLTESSWKKFCDVARTQFAGRPFVAVVLPINTYKNLAGGTEDMLIRAYNSAGGLWRCVAGGGESDLESALKRARKILVNAFPVLVQTEGGDTPKNDLYVLVVGVWQGA